MTFKESEYPDLLENLLDLIQREDGPIPPQKLAEIVRQFHSQTPLYPGLVSAQLEPYSFNTSGAGNAQQTVQEIFQKSSEKAIPEDWDALVQRLLKTKGNQSEKGHAFSAMVMGEMDTGKTFLITYFANQLTRLGKRVAILDCDMGQSDIGPPGTIGLAVMEKPVSFLRELRGESLYFVGSHSASLHFLPTLVGASKLAQRGRARADILLIDTSGWVYGDSARSLRQAELELIRPDLILLLQREKELEPMVKSYPQEKIVRLKVSPHVALTSNEERKKLRENLSRRYFSQAGEIELEWERNQRKTLNTERTYLLSGEETHPASVKTVWGERYSKEEGILVVVEKPLRSWDILALQKEYGVKKVKVILTGEESGILSALCDERSEVIALGIIIKIEYPSKKIKIFSPIDKKSLARVKIIQFGSLRLLADGSESGFVKPGTF